MIDAFLAVMGIVGGVSLALVFAGIISDGLLPLLERFWKSKRRQSTYR